MSKPTKRKRVKRLFLTAFGLLLIWVTAVGWSIWSCGHNDESQKSDCIIVLGAAAYGSEPSPVFEGRLLHAITLYQNKLADRIILTGGFGEGASESESAVGAAYLIKAGIPKSALLTEEVSKTTLQNLTHSKRLMQENQLNTAILTSDPYHLRRAQLMAKNLQIDTVTSPTPHTRYRSFGKRAKFLLWEIYLCHHYWFFRE